MRANKTRAFELFDQGNRPSDIYDQVPVTKRTLYAYYQEWKKVRAKEREEEEKQRRQEEVNAMLAREEVEKQRKRAAIAKGLQEKLEKERQRRHNLELHFQGLQFKIRDLEWELWKASSKPNNRDEVQRIGTLYSQAYQRFIWVVPQLYPKETNPDRLLLPHVTEDVFSRSVFAAKKAAATKTGTTGRGKRDYVLGAKDLPLYVGEGVGDMDYEGAVKLSANRLARGGVQAGSPR